MNRQEKRSADKQIKKATKLKAVKTAAKEPEIPKDLQDKWGAVEAVATVHGLLQKGMFPYNCMTIVGASLEFIARLHENTVNEALKHPQSDLIPQLKALKEQAATDGKKA